MKSSGESCAARLACVQDSCCLGAGVTGTDRPSLARGDDTDRCGWGRNLRKAQQYGHGQGTREGWVLKFEGT